MADIRAELSKYPVKTRVMLTGPMVVARDIAHAKIKERLDARRADAAVPEGLLRVLRRPGQDARGHGQRLVRPHHGRPHGQLRRRVPGRRRQLRDARQGQPQQGQVTDACKAHGGFYLGSIGGPAARLAQDCITKVEVLEMPELGMEAVWKIEVQDFPAFIVVDDKGNDFFDLVNSPTAARR